MWNFLAPYVLRLLDMWNCVVLYVLRWLGRRDPSPGPENEACDNINLFSQMVDEEDDSGTATGGDYDVFLSFRGPDTRNTFTDCLYVFMRTAGIRVFRDDEELRPGEKISEILQAIKRSQIYIPIFSKNYASSKWCLRELTCMVECTRRYTGKEILPIFYDVDPLDVKLETELYKSALRKHKDHGCKEAWKGALTTVARIKGWHLKDKGQGGVIKDVIQEVLQKITTTERNLPTHLVGIDDHIEAIKKWLNCDLSDVRFVIIHGIGGIGKTTLAEVVFNQLSPQFESHSFLSRESSQCGGIVEMQRKLAADLFGFSLCETSDFKEGNNRIRKRLPNKQVLLVFDGMDENDRFMQLAKNCTLCGPGSRIIITTRDKSIFSKTKVEGLEKNILTGSTRVFLYEMKEMHFDHALQLFNKLAFNTDSAPHDLYHLSRDVVKLTGGLPLALEVIGLDLRNQKKAKWKSTVEKLKKMPHREVQQKLKISYDALECGAKQIFLDIACFFVNKKISNAMYMWEDCDLSPKVEIDVLISKSLIKIVDHDRIWMHDQLRSLGRAIVYQENMGNSGDESRLWFLKTIPKMGTKNAVALRQRRLEHNFTREDFANLTNARFLILDGGNFTGNFEGVLPKLRWFCWRNCPLKLQANNFVLDHLVVLKLSGDITTKEWSGWVQIMVANKLKVLKIAGSKSLIKTPCFSKFMSLERLVLKNFLGLVEIDCSIGKLEGLICLKIKYCPLLRGLPKEIGYLTALRELVLIQDFSVRYLPNSIGNLSLLSRLVLEDIGLVELPDTIKGLVDLEYLCLANCRSINLLPDAVGELKMLTELDLSGTTIQDLPHSIWNLQGLRLLMNSGNIRKQVIMTDLTDLEAIGGCSYVLRLKDTAESENVPKVLSEECPEKVRSKLILSCDALEYGAEQILLDLACFLIDKGKNNAAYMGKACGLVPKVEFDVLVDKFSLEIFYYARRWIPGDQGGLWLPGVDSDILVQAQKGIEIAATLPLWRLRYNFTSEDFSNIMNVRFFACDGGNFAEDFEDILPKRIWLCWPKCHPQLRANKIFPNHLVILQLLGYVIKNDCIRWDIILVSNTLKVLEIKGFKSLRKTPCFSKLKSLESLHLIDLPRLTEFVFSKLERLTCLHITYCPRLT